MRWRENGTLGWGAERLRFSLAIRSVFAMRLSPGIFGAVGYLVSFGIRGDSRGSHVFFISRLERVGHDDGHGIARNSFTQASHGRR